MAWTGDYLDVIQEFLNVRPMDDLIPAVVHRNPMYSRIRKATRAGDFYGKYALMRLQTDMPMIAGPRVERSDVFLPGKDGFAEIRIHIKQYMASMGFTEEEAEEAVRKNNAAVADLVEIKMANTKTAMNVILNHAFAGDGTGRLARVKAYSSGEVEVDNTQANFGWDDVSFIKKGMLVDIYTVGDITGTADWTVKAKHVKVTSVSKSTKKFTIAAIVDDPTSAISASPADGDFVFLVDSVQLADKKFAGWTNTPGLLAIVDDGVTNNGHEFSDGLTNAYNGSWYGKVFQHIDRTQVDAFQSLVRRADDWGSGTAGTKTTCDLKVVNETIRMIDEEGNGGGAITALYMNGKTRDWLAELASSAGNAFVNVNSGKIVPGMYVESYRTSTGKVLPIIPIQTVPDGVIIGLDERDLRLFEQQPIDWYRRNGQISFASPGERNLTNEMWLRTKMVLGANRCDNAFRIEDIDTD